MAKKQTDSTQPTVEEILSSLNASIKPTIGIKPLSTSLTPIPTEQATESISAMLPLANASLEEILRNPHKFASQAVAAAKEIYARTLGAIPETMIQNNMQFMVKWED